MYRLLFLFYHAFGLTAEELEAFGHAEALGILLQKAAQLALVMAQLFRAVDTGKRRVRRGGEALGVPKDRDLPENK